MTSILDIINIPLGYVIKFAYYITDNYALALLLFAIVMQIILLPLGIKQQKNQIKQASLAPKVAAINKKYAGRTDKATQEKKNAEVMEMYQRENFNPAGGCLPLLLQMPILIALYNVVRFPLRYICSIGADVLNKVTDALNAFSGQNFTNNQIGMTQYIASNFDSIKSVTVDGGATIGQIFEGVKLPNFMMFGLDLSEVPQITWPPKPLIILPIVMLAALYLSQILMKKFQYQDPTTKDAQNNCSMKVMMWSMPLLSFFFAFRLAAAICLYWLYSNLIQLLKSFILAKVMPLPRYTEEDYKKAEKEIMSSSQKKREKKENAGKVRSLHHIDDDDYIDEQPKPQPKKKKNNNATVEETPVDSSADMAVEEPSEAVEEKSEFADDPSRYQYDEFENNEEKSSLIEQAPLKDEENKKN